MKWFNCFVVDYVDPTETVEFQKSQRKVEEEEEEEEEEEGFNNDFN